MTYPSNQIVFRSPWLARKLVFTLVGLVLSIALTLKLHSAVGWVALLFVLPLLVSRPRKIALCEDEVTYWPPLGGPQRIRLDDVTAITLASAGEAVPFGWVQSFPGAKLQLSNGLALTIPLDIPNHEEVLQRIITAWQQRVGAQARGDKEGQQTSPR